MAEPWVDPTVNGQELKLQDVALLGKVAALADDRVLAEILRLTPYDGSNVVRAIVPSSPSPTVAPSGSGNGSITVNPFRAVIGTRVTAGSSPIDNWRDIRSTVWVGTGGLSQSFALSANVSGNPRWDLVYAAVTVDTPQNSNTYRIKDATSGNVSTSPEPQYLATTVSIQVLTGTPGASPALPAVPADSGNVFNVPLAYIRVPTGFGGTSTVQNGDVRSYGTATSTYRALRAGFHAEPATGNNDRAGTYATNSAFQWAAGTANSRPDPFIPPDMVGGASKFVEIDAHAAGSGNWSHPTGGVVDDSIDWRGRFIFAIFAGSANGGGQVLATSKQNVEPRTPSPIISSHEFQGFQVGNTMPAPVDGTLVASTATVCILNATNISQLPAGAICGLYVDMTTGKLLWTGRGTGSSADPSAYLFFWLFASAQMTNF